MADRPGPSRRAVLAGGAALLCPASSQSRAGPSQKAEIAVDSRVRHQRIDGFGSSARVFDDPHVFDTFDPATGRAATRLTQSQQGEILDRLYRDLRLRRLRPVFDFGGIERQGGNADPEVIDPADFDFSWKRNDAHVELAQRAMRRGVTTVFPTTLGFEPWMHHGIDPDRVARWTLARLLRWRDRGIALRYYSLINEPGHPPSGVWSGEFLRDVIKCLGPRSRASGLPTRFVVPDDLGPDQALLRSRIILADAEARGYVGALAYHLYSGGPQDRRAVQALGHRYGLPVWMTEFSSFGQGGDWLGWAALMHDLLAEYDVSAVDYMWGFFGQWEHIPANLITLRTRGHQYVGYHLTPEYFVTGHFSRHVAPGMRRIAATGTADLKASAYTDGKVVALVVVNGGEAAIEASLRLDPEAAVTGTRLRQITTDRTRRWAEVGTVSLRAGVTPLALAPRSISTFTSLESADPGW